MVRKPNSRTSFLFGPYAPQPWKFDTAILIFSLGIFSFAVITTVHFTDYNYWSATTHVNLHKGTIIVWQCLVPSVTIIVSIANLLVYFSPKPIGRYVCLHPLYTTILGLIFAHGWIVYLVFLWIAPMVSISIAQSTGSGLRDKASSWDDFFIEWKTACSIIVIWLYATYASMSFTAMALLKHGGRKRQEIGAIDEPIELTTLDQRVEEEPQGSSPDIDAPIRTSDFARAPAFERTGTRPDVDLSALS